MQHRLTGVSNKKVQQQKYPHSSALPLPAAARHRRIHLKLPLYIRRKKKWVRHAYDGPHLIPVPTESYPSAASDSDGFGVWKEPLHIYTKRREKKCEFNRHKNHCTFHILPVSLFTSARSRCLTAKGLQIWHPPDQQISAWYQQQHHHQSQITIGAIELEYLVAPPPPA